MLSTLAAIFTHMSMSLMMNFNEVWQLRLVAEKHLDNSNTMSTSGCEENQIMGKDSATYDNAKDV